MTGVLLVVSDDPEVSEELSFGLPGGIEVASATDAREALARLASMTPRAVVVDLQTGSAGGFALARDMAQTARLASIPVIVLLDRDADGWLADQAGAALWLKKPVDGSILLAAVSSVLEAKTPA
jgi:two-component system response regulator MprA